MPEALIDRDHMFDVDGFTVGSGQRWAFIQADGLDMPEFRSDEVNRPQEHGAFVLGPDYMTGRYVRMQVGVEGDYGTADYASMMDSVKRTMRPRDADFPLRWRYSGSEIRRLYVRPRRCQFNLDANARAGILIANLEFFAQDPLVYEDQERLTNMTPGLVSGGMAFPHGFPHGFGAATPFSYLISNYGTFATHPYGRIMASAEGIGSITMTNVSTGKVFQLDTTLLGGEFIDFDFQNQTVLFGGLSSRIADVVFPTSTWWTLEPGDNTIELSIVKLGTGSVAVEFRHRSAYL